MRLPLLSTALLLQLIGQIPMTQAATFAEEPHLYWKREPNDRLTRAMAEVESGTKKLDQQDEKAFLSSLLKVLEIDDSTQMLVFSATSLQSGRINPRNPRAIYFNEDTSVGFVPGGQIEVASFDPEAGIIFYIFDRASGADNQPKYQRSNRCMNCHADTQTNFRPGMILNSVAVWWDGSTQETYRYDELGHHVPLDQRFGGWHLTGKHGMKQTHANLVGAIKNGKFEGEANPPGKHASLDRYLRPTSDILTQLVHEHQTGFINRVIHAVYSLREGAQAAEVDKLAEDMAKYILFIGEAKLPSGLEGDADFVKNFQARSADKASAPLRQFDLKNRLFRLPCSYMVDSDVWRAVPAEFRTKVNQHLAAATDANRPSALGQGLSVEQRQEIRSILMAVSPKS